MSLEPPPPPPTPSHGVRILLVDDSRADRALAARALRGLAAPPGPASVVGAADWAAAEPLLAAGGFDLVLLDFHMPGADGLAVLQALRDRAHPPIVMLTGLDDVATAIETLRQGAADYVSKCSPEWGTFLCVAVERVLAHAAPQREVAAARVRLATHAHELERKVEARTALVRAQAAQIEELYLHAEEASRVKAEIVANVSHELRTPLNVILGYTELLGEQLPPQSEADEMLAKVREHALRLRELIDSMLELDRLRRGTEGILASRFRLALLVRELRAEAKDLAAGTAVVIEWEPVGAADEVYHDREKVRGIAYHLLSNAIKFSPDGRVTVRLAATADGGVTVAVRDTGVGMPPEARAVVLDDFRQLDGSSTRRFGGLGLGLGIVRRYTTLLGGAIAIEIGRAHV